MAGCAKDPSIKELTGLTEPVDYHYLDQSGVVVAEGFNDEAEYEDMVRSSRTPSGNRWSHREDRPVTPRNNDRPGKRTQVRHAVLLGGREALGL